MESQKYKLNTGAEIPAVGLGTWQSKAGEVEKVDLLLYYLVTP
jgi:diketogulonate reductase-like aldo/keto reductase